MLITRQIGSKTDRVGLKNSQRKCDESARGGVGNLTSGRVGLDLDRPGAPLDVTDDRVEVNRDVQALQFFEKNVEKLLITTSDVEGAIAFDLRVSFAAVN